MPGGSGICRVRSNIGGKLYSLNFGSAASQMADPVEKKPLHHFMPGSATWSFGAPGCNFTCSNCQNWQISQARPDELDIRFTAPEEVVENAIRAGCPSISCTYTEPTIFAEYAIDIMKKARSAGLKTIWVSNGYMSPNCLDAIGPWLDAANIDLKSMDDAFYRRFCGALLEPVLDNLRRISRSGIHLEVATLVIPGQSDSPAMLERLAGFIVEDLGPDIPWHIIPFYPEISWKMQNTPATPASSLESAWKIGRKAGLHYIYDGHTHTDTVCPNCGHTAIERRPWSRRTTAVKDQLPSFGTTLLRLDDDGRCASCHDSLSIKR
jgi:pyruvate formate lyase activating enzyme